MICILGVNFTSSVMHEEAFLWVGQFRKKDTKHWNVGSAAHSIRTRGKVFGGKKIVLIYFGVVQIINHWAGHKKGCSRLCVSVCCFISSEETRHLVGLQRHRFNTSEPKPPADQGGVAALPTLIRFPVQTWTLLSFNQLGSCGSALLTGATQRHWRIPPHI